MLYICGLLTNEPQLIPNDNAWHIVRFPFEKSADAEQSDEWFMHEANRRRGYVKFRVVDWQNDDRSGLIFPAIQGYGRMNSMVHWDSAITSRSQFARDPLGYTTGLDTTRTIDHSGKFTGNNWEIMVRPRQPLALRVKNTSPAPATIVHAQFKLIIDTEIGRN